MSLLSVSWEYFHELAALHRKDDYIKTYYNLVAEYDDLIIGQLFGHLHSDEFRVGHSRSVQGNTNDTNIQMIPMLRSPLLLGPSITPIHGNNPAYKLVKYGFVGGNKKDELGGYKLLDYDSYSYVPGDEDWKKLYTFSEVYSSSYTPEEGLSSNTMRSVVESMENSMRIRGDSSLLTSFRTLLMSGGVSKTQHAGSGIECNDKCKNEWLCTIQSATRDGYDNCLSLRQRSSREKAAAVLLLSLTAVVVVVFALAFRVRRRKAIKRKLYDETDSVEGDIRLSIQNNL